MACTASSSNVVLLPGIRSSRRCVMMLLVAVVMYSRLKPVCLVTGGVPLRALMLLIQVLRCAHLVDVVLAGV